VRSGKNRFTGRFREADQHMANQRSDYRHHRCKNTVTWQRGCKVLSTILGVWSFFSSWPIKSLIECLIKSCQPDCCSDALSSISYETLECKLLQMDTNMACCCLRHWRRMNRRWSPRWVGPQQDESTGKWTTLCSAVENEWCFVS
jgi:hypothetical protein